MPKENDEENVKFTNAKLELYESYPRQPTEKDINEDKFCSNKTVAKYFGSLRAAQAAAEKRKRR